MKDQPLAVFVIDDLETLRVVSDPLRAQIYEILIETPANVRQVADRLGMAASRLYYHINLLEKHGLVRVVETRMISNMVEKVYRAVAYDLDIAPNLLNFSTDEGQQTIREVLVSGLDMTREDMLRSLQARLFDLEQGKQKKTRSMMINRATARIPDAVAEEFQKRLQALIEEFRDQDAEEEASSEEASSEAALPEDASSEAASVEERQGYALLIAFYPTFYYEEAA